MSVGRPTVLQILGKSSSIHVRKVLWVCAELELPYAHEPWSFGAVVPLTERSCQLVQMWRSWRL